MRRDFELIRLILQEVEELQPGSNLQDFTYPGYDDLVTNAHVVLMIEANLLKGVDATGLDSAPKGIVFGLTWTGHDFLGSIKDDTLWAKAKEKVIKPAGGVAFSVLVEWVKAEASQRLGIS